MARYAPPPDMSFDNWFREIIDLLPESGNKSDVREEKKNQKNYSSTDLNVNSHFWHL
jgi:hypothetical protein